MPKDKVYVFTENGARILTNPSNIEELRKQKNVLINPTDVNTFENHAPELLVLNKEGKIGINTKKSSKYKLFNPLRKGPSPFSREIILKLMLFNSVFISLAYLLGRYFHV